LPYTSASFFIKEEQKAFAFLMQQFDISQKISQRWIDKRRVYCNGILVQKKSQMISGAIEVIYFKPQNSTLTPIFEAKQFVLYDKPSKMLVHPRNRATTHSLLDTLKAQYGQDANVVHRIDYETSGVVLCAKDKSSEIALKTLFEERVVQKSYLALVVGRVGSKLEIDLPIGKKEDSLIKIKMFVQDGGKPSQSVIEPLEYFPSKNATLVSVQPLTGRQHQIRSHLFHVKHPIIGDPIYGPDETWTDRFLNRLACEEERMRITGGYRLMLHAQKIEFSFGNPYILTSRSKLPI
jgi:23S rRNA pseudouridine1911/1915/1917 synthase